MTVENQIPYQSFTANGSQTNFALGFYVDGKDHFEVKKNDQVVSKNDYRYESNSNSIVFNTTLNQGDAIEIQRSTIANRATNYATYNNSFRPEVLNKDIDRIWLKIQELGVADALLKVYADRLHATQQQNIDNKDQIIHQIITDLQNYVNDEKTNNQNKLNDLKGYVDTQDNKRNIYFENLINKQGLALDQLENFYNDLLKSLAKISVERGWDASFIADGSKTQKEINDLLAHEYYVENWGAKGDGITFDADAINLAITELSKAFKADGKPRTLLFRPDRIYVARLIKLKAGVNLICPNGTAKILRTPATPETTEATAKWWRIIDVDVNSWTTETDLEHRVTIKNLILDGNYNNTNWTWNTYNQEQASCMILMGNQNFPNQWQRSKFHIENVLFMNSVSDGLHVWRNTDITFKGLMALRCFRGGLVFTGGNSIVRGDGMVSFDARMDVEIDSTGIGGTFKSYLYLINYYQDVGSDAPRYFTGGCDIGGMGGGVMHLNNVNVHSYPLNVFFAREANQKFEKLLIENSVFHTTGQPWYNPTNGTIRNTKIILRNDIKVNANIPILMNYNGYKQSSLTEFIFDNCIIESQDPNLEGSTTSAIRVESHMQDNQMRLVFKNCDLSKVAHPTSFYGVVGCNFYIEGCKINTKTFVGAAGAYTSSPGYPVRITLGYNELGENVTTYLSPAFGDTTTNINELTFLPNCSLPARANQFVYANGQNGYPNIKTGYRKITGTTAPTLTMSAYKDDIYELENKILGYPYEWISIVSKTAFTANSKWQAIKWLTGSFATSDLPILTSFDIGVVNYDTTKKKFVKWNGTAWLEDSPLISSSITYDPPSLAANTIHTTELTLTGIQMGQPVIATFSLPLNGTQLWAEVTATGKVTVYHKNMTASATDLASGTLTVKAV